MGYERHRAIIVTSWDDKKLAEAHDEALAIFPPSSLLGPTLQHLVGPITTTGTNGYASFLISPDGSKVGWETSDIAEACRRTFVDWLDAQRYDDGSTSLDWVEVQYGDDDGHTFIVSDSDEHYRRSGLSENGESSQ